ncbi:uncharacterized protein LOC106635094 [Pan paniscus]|uniref:uncharacterized protein LOC106635094 n=1 Tax=Pan paniscus TaxID=9597 RepID=UPI0030040F1F
MTMTRVFSWCTVAQKAATVACRQPCRRCTPCAREALPRGEEPQRTVQHFRYFGWRDYGVRTDPAGVLGFRDEVNRAQSREPRAGPMVVHFSCGGAGPRGLCRCRCGGAGPQGMSILPLPWPGSSSGPCGEQRWRVQGMQGGASGQQWQMLGLPPTSPRPDG